MLKDLEKDLKKYNPSYQEENSLSTETPSSIKETRWYTKKGNRKYLFISIGIVILIAMLTSVGTYIPSWIYKYFWQKPKQESHVLEVVKTQIDRFIEDCNLSVDESTSEFPEESARIAHSAGIGGMAFNLRLNQV